MPKRMVHPPRIEIRRRAARDWRVLLCRNGRALELLDAETSELKALAGARELSARYGWAVSS